MRRHEGDQNSWIRLLQVVKKARETLTSSEEAKMKIDVLVRNHDFEEVLTRDEFISLVQDQTEPTFKALFDKVA